MTDINEIKAMALAYGACEKASGITSIKEAVELLMSPQGREFAVKSGFPTYELLRRVADSLYDEGGILINGVYFLVDSVHMILHNEDFIAAGESRVTVDFMKPDRLHHIVAMHGAKVKVKASNFAGVTVSSYDSEVTVENDGTARVTIEQKGGNQ